MSAVKGAKMLPVLNRPKIWRFFSKIYYAIISAGKIPESYYSPDSISWLKAWDYVGPAAYSIGLDDAWHSSERVAWDIVGKHIETRCRKKALLRIKNLCNFNELSDKEIARVSYRMIEKTALIGFFNSAIDFENGILNQIYMSVFENIDDDLIRSDPIMTIDNWYKFKASNNLDKANEFFKFWIDEIDKTLFMIKKKHSS